MGTVRQALSKRELQVARHVARGGTNRDIAIALRISEKTVEKHLSSIFRKLGLASRSQLAVHVVLRDLVPSAALG